MTAHRRCAQSFRTAVRTYLKRRISIRIGSSSIGVQTMTRLDEIKHKYDPTGLFIVHNGVGSEGWSRDGFTRLS